MMSKIKKIAAWPYLPFVVGAITTLAAVVLSLALFSFNPFDASWLYHSSEVVPVTNMLGKFGAHLAALFFYSFGFASWVFVGLLGYVSYLLFFRIQITKEWDRLSALVLLLFAVSGVLTLYSFDVANVVPGGVVGVALRAITVRWFESIGSALFLHSLLLISLMLVFRASFVKLLYAIVAAARFVCSREKFLIPAYRVSKKTAHVISVPFVWSARFLRRLFNGDDVTASGESIVSFEQQLLDEVEQNRSPLDHNDFEIAPSVSTSRKHGITNFQKHSLEKKEDAPSLRKTTVGMLEIVSATVDTKKEQPVPNLDFKQQEVEAPEKKEYALPHKELFGTSGADDGDDKEMTELEKRAKILEEKLERFGVQGSVVSIKRGPVVTLFEYQPQIDSKISKIIALEDDLALALKALSIRIIAPIPGKSVVGLEVANAQRNNVLLSSVIRSKAFENSKSSLPLVLGKDTIGNNVLVDLARMPHLLIAGSTGSGKSVALNTFLVSLLCKLTPDQLKLILIDPKRLEFASYADIAHLLFPIITDPKRTAPVLRWVVNQMEERYEKMAAVGARSIFDYNATIMSGARKDLEHTETLPFIVIVVDELSDLMMTAGRDIEDLIARIAQMARAAGIHMIVATQRPSVDVITGLIKVNFPSRISFRVTSKVDSRTILDCGGAEKLLGFGDMLFLDSRSSTLRRLHGAYVSNEEIDSLARHIRSERKVEYLDLTQELMEDKPELSQADDELYQDVVGFLGTVDEVSISLLQRKFRIGYNRSARIIDLLESRGIIMPSEGSKMRKVIH